MMFMHEHRLIHRDLKPGNVATCFIWRRWLQNLQIFRPSRRVHNIISGCLLNANSACYAVLK
jgi:hypothetical protein